MSESKFCISIPKDLKFFLKNSINYEPENPFPYPSQQVNFVNNESGTLSCAEYYSAGKLKKKVFYDSFCIEKIEHFSNNILSVTEIIKDNRIIEKFEFDTQGNKTAHISYEYDKKSQIIGIKKKVDGKEYLVKYEYDELARLNGRKIYYNSTLLLDQTYRYDILDRITEYRDSNQRIVVNKISQDNRLISYTIIDKMGNNVSITNNFIEGKYVNTEIVLNGHSKYIEDKNYLDNAMLKKPYTHEDDIDMIISNLVRANTMEIKTARVSFEDNVNNMIDKNITTRTLPISIRKRLLYNIAINS